MALPQIFKLLHGAVNTATASRLMLRDNQGRVKVNDPLEDDDVATKKKHF
jgi:hypothetical protein